MALPLEPQEVFIRFIVTYLTEQVNMDPRAQRQRSKGMVKYDVYAKNAEDAIRRLREQEPIEHPIIEIASVTPTENDTTQLILPIEWNVAANMRANRITH